MVREYHVYIMTNRSGTLYIGVTNNLLARVYQHRNATSATFTGRYKMDRLLYFESTDDVTAAIAREKELKGWVRRRKVVLIETMNPRWLNLSDGWFDDVPSKERLSSRLDSSPSATGSE